MRCILAWMGDSRDLSRALHTSIRGLPKDWSHRPGRPRHTWLRTLETDFQPLHHGLISAWRHAQDRGRWKQLVETAMLQSWARLWWWCCILHRGCGLDLGLDLDETTRPRPQLRFHGGRNPVQHHDLVRWLYCMCNSNRHYCLLFIVSQAFTYTLCVLVMMFASLPLFSMHMFDLSACVCTVKDVPLTVDYETAVAILAT